MTDFTKELQELGVEVGKAPSEPIAYSLLVSQNAVAFSAYGTFTPIKVTSGTTIVDANLERDK